MEQKTNIGNAFLTLSALKIYGVLAIVFLTIPIILGAIGFFSGKMTAKAVVQFSSAILPIYIGYALRFYLVRTMSNLKKNLQDAITPDEAFKVIFGGFLWGFPVVCIATACYFYTKNTLW